MGLFMQNSDVVITVLMTVYNGSRYLKDSIESVLKQTYKSFEFLIINDKSSDDSLEILESFHDPRIKIYTNEKNIGQIKSLNKGLKLAKGQYIARMDADDMAFPHWLEKQISFMEKHAECAVVSTKAVAIDSSNRLTKVLNSPRSFQNIVLKSLIFSPINHVGSLLRKDIMLNHGGYDEDFKIAADYDLWARFIQEGYRLESTQEISVAIRFHEQSISIMERGRADLLEISRVMRKNITALTDIDIDDQNAQLLWKLIYNVEALSNDEFRDCNEKLEAIFKNIKASFEIAPSLITEFSRKIFKVIYIKKIFVLIDRCDIKTIKVLARDYIQKYGRLNLFSVIWVFSLLGTAFLRYLPSFYNNFVGIWARFRLIGKTI